MVSEPHCRALKAQILLPVVDTLPQELTPPLPSGFLPPKCVPFSLTIYTLAFLRQSQAPPHAWLGSILFSQTGMVLSPENPVN